MTLYGIMAVMRVYRLSVGLDRKFAGEEESNRTIAWVAKALISLMARGALFLKVTPCNFSNTVSQTLFQNRYLSSVTSYRQTYSLVEVDGVLASDDIRNGGALGLAGGLLSGRHF